MPSGGGTKAGWRSVAEGMRFLRGQGLLASTFVIDIDAMVFGMPRALFPALGTGLAAAARDGRAVVLGSGGGAPVGALLTGWVAGVRRQGRAVVVAVVVWGAAIAALGLIPVLWIGLGLLALAGAADVISAVFRTAILQTTVPDHLQGRLGGVFTAVVTGGPRLGDAEAGAVAAIGGRQTSVRPRRVRRRCTLIVWRVPELWSYELTTRAGGHLHDRGCTQTWSWS